MQSQEVTGLLPGGNESCLNLTHFQCSPKKFRDYYLAPLLQFHHKYTFNAVPRSFGIVTEVDKTLALFTFQGCIARSSQPG